MAYTLKKSLTTEDQYFHLFIELLTDINDKDNTASLLEQSYFKDVRHEPEYQVLGADALYYNKLIEAKFEQYDSGNISAEIVSVDKSRTWGWTFTSQAHWLMTLLIPTGDCIITMMPEINQFVLQKMRRAHLKTDTLKIHKIPNRGYNTYNSVIPVNQLLSELPHCYCVKMEELHGFKPTSKKIIVPEHHQKIISLSHAQDMLKNLHFKSHAIVPKTTPASIEAMDTIKNMAIKPKKFQRIKKIKI